MFFQSGAEAKFQCLASADKGSSAHWLRGQSPRDNHPSAVPHICKVKDFLDVLKFIALLSGHC